MYKNITLLTIFAFYSILAKSDAAVDLVYAIKEQAYEQYGNSQPVGPVWWGFGAGAIGDQQLTALSVTLPGSSGPIAVPGEPGSFDLETSDYATQQELDAAHPNGNILFSITDGTTRDLGPFSLTGDSYPVVPHLTNVEQLQASDYSQDFELTWDAFTGFSEGDQILIQIFDYSSDEDLLFEFLDATATFFTIPGGTFAPDNYYEIQVVFISQTDSFSDPQAIIGYLTSTSHILSTQTSDTRLLLYKWQAMDQTGPGTFADFRYRLLSTVTGKSRTVSGAQLITPVSGFPVDFFPFGQNAFILTGPFGAKETLDTEYPVGSYEFIVTENDIATTYGPYYLPEDDYPANPEVLNFNELQDFDVSQPQAVQVNAIPFGVSLIQMIVADGNGDQIWANSYGPASPVLEIPAGTLLPDAVYRLIIRYWAPKTSNEKPPTTVGFISSIGMPLNGAHSPGGGDPVVDLAYVLKSRNYIQQGTVAPESPQSYSLNAGVSGTPNILSASLVHPSGTTPMDGFDGEFDLSDVDYPSMAELDTAFPDGQYDISLSTIDISQDLGPFQLTGSVYPNVPHIGNVADLESHDLNTGFELTWNSFSSADPDDLVVLEIYDETIDEEALFERLDATTTSYVIPAGTLSQDRNYSIQVIFINRVDALESAEIIVGYMSNTESGFSTYTSDTDIVFYKTRMYSQVSDIDLLEVGYRPLTLVSGNSNSVSYAEIQTPVNLYSLNNINVNLFALVLAFGPKENLDADYPPGEYRFGLVENEEFITYGPYVLPGDAYPDPPVIENFNDLQVFDATKDQSINWSVPSGDVTRVGVQIRDTSFALVWSESFASDATNGVIPASTLSQNESYYLHVQFWANKSESSKPATQVGYGTVTRMTAVTSPYSLGYLNWLSQYFTQEQILDPGIVGETVDYDGDKLSNYFEFRANLIPTDQNSRLGYDFEFGDADLLRIRNVSGQLPWQIHSSTNLLEWNPVAAEMYTTLEDEIQIDLQSFLPGSFFRLVFVEPGQ